MTRGFFKIGGFWAGVALVAAIGGWLVTKLDAQPTIALPIATVTNVTGSAVQIIGANPSRRSIQICIPAVAQTVTIAPAPITPVAGTLGISLVGNTTGQGPQCFTPPANVLSGGSAGGAGSAWNAIATAGTNVTVLEW